MDGAALRLACASHQMRLLEDLDVLRDALDGHLERFGEFVDSGGPGGQPGDDLPARRVCESQECPVEILLVEGHVFNSFLDQPFG